MILTVTFNPAVDLDFIINDLRPGGRYRANISQRSPGGAGINISIILGRLGLLSIATGFLAGFNASYILDFLRREKVSSHFIHTRGETRINVCITDTESSVETRLHELGVEIRESDKAAFLRGYERTLSRVGIVAMGGSLPPGVDSSIYAPLMRSARNNSIPTILHPREDDLEAVLDEIPTVVKLDYQTPRADEPQPGALESFIARTRDLHRRGTEWALASLSRNKVAFSSRKGVWLAEAPVPEMRYVYAVEDALLSGVIAAMQEQASFEDIIRFAMACWWECASHPEKFPADRARVAALSPRVLLSKLE